jgi:hypothetical protein
MQSKNTNNNGGDMTSMNAVSALMANPNNLSNNQ